MELKAKVKVKNSMGLHTRPATAIVKLLQGCKSEVLFTHKQVTVDAKSILGILMLAARKNARIDMTVRGEDATKTLEQLIDAFENEFGER